MITCEMAHELLLEAEPAELRGEGDGELAQHLRACAGCRQQAALILAETETLRSTIQGLHPSGIEPSPVFTVAGGTAKAATQHRWRVLVPLALAAGIAALGMVRRHDVTAPSGPPIQVATATPPALDVQVPAGQSVAVFQTANPNVVVIWSY